MNFGITAPTPFFIAVPNVSLTCKNTTDFGSIDLLVAGCDAIVHLGGVSVEAAFDPILQANIVGVFNLYEAARKQGVTRIVFASSNHAFGMYGVLDPLEGVGWAGAPVLVAGLAAAAVGLHLGGRRVRVTSMQCTKISRSRPDVSCRAVLCTSTHMIEPSSCRR